MASTPNKLDQAYELLVSFRTGVAEFAAKKGQDELLERITDLVSSATLLLRVAQEEAATFKRKHSK